MIEQYGTMTVRIWGVVTRFRRESEPAVYAISDGKWTRLELPQFDPLQDGQEALRIEGPSTDLCRPGIWPKAGPRGHYLIQRPF